MKVETGADLSSYALLPLLDEGIFVDGVDHGVELIGGDEDLSVDEWRPRYGGGDPGYDLDKGRLGWI